jgi:hypothetical protein
MRLNDIVVGEEYMVRELRKALLPKPPYFAMERGTHSLGYYTRVKVLAVRVPFKTRLDGVSVEFVHERMTLDPMTDEFGEETVTTEGIVHHSKIAKPWAEHELAMEVWRFERLQKRISHLEEAYLEGAD